MSMRLRRQHPVTPGSTSVPAAKTSHAAGLARTRWWPRCALAGAILAVVGVTLLTGAAQVLVALLGVTVFLFAVAHGLRVHDRDPVRAEEGRHQMTLGRSSEIGSRREPPVPPGESGPG